jgi:hypothetical protein
MKQIELDEMESVAPLLCQGCGGLMRLIGSEPHPVEAKTDLLTYCCTTCDEFNRSRHRQTTRDLDLARRGMRLAQ